ncbi:MAG: hypothetical protein ABJP45_14745 [Cyclobacteriaceae bacterium]
MKEEKEKYAEFLNYDHKKSVRLGLYASHWNEGDHIVMFIPALRLSSYGKTLKEAEYMMWEIVVEAFFNDLFDMKKTDALNTLYNLGWKQNKIFSKKLNHSEAYVDESGILQEFNLPKGTKIRQEFVTQA